MLIRPEIHAERAARVRHWSWNSFLSSLCELTCSQYSARNDSGHSRCLGSHASNPLPVMLNYSVPLPLSPSLG